MFDYIWLQIILSGEKLTKLAQWVIPIGISSTALIYALKRDSKKDHEDKHKAIKDDCEKLLEKMEATIIKNIEDRDAANWRSHGEIRTEMELILKQSMELVKSIDQNVKILMQTRKK